MAQNQNPIPDNATIVDIDDVVIAVHYAADLQAGTRPMDIYLQLADGEALCLRTRDMADTTSVLKALVSSVEHALRADVPIDMVAIS